MIEILTTGLANSVQDLGRSGFLAQGIGQGGAMDRPALMVANWLAGNDAWAAALEIASFPFRLRFEAPCRLAVCGADAAITLAGRVRAPWLSMMAQAGDELRIDPPSAGARLFIAVSGGIIVPPVMGSGSTDLKSGFGGHEGRHLKRGDRLAIGNGPIPKGRMADLFGIDPAILRTDAGGIASGQPQTIHVMNGAEWDDFEGPAQPMLTSTDWRVTAEANRQGVKLDGPKLDHHVRRDLFSHGIMPGTIQVPPNGQPIIQLADANTCGGYPKIATVIAPDLWRLGQAPVGSTIRFVTIDRKTAIEAVKDERNALARIAALIKTQWTSDRKALPA